MENYLILAPLIIQLVGIIPFVLTDNYLRREQRMTMMNIITLIAIMIAQNCISYLLQTSVSMPYVRIIVSIVGYAVRPAIILLFSMLVAPDRNHYFPIVLVTLNTLTYLTATFSSLVFTISEDNHFVRGPLGYTAFFMSALMMIYLVFITIYEYRNRKYTLVMALSITAIIVLSAGLELTPADIEAPASYTTIATVSCSIFYYIWLHMEFVHDHESDLMAQQRIKIMMTQIQPHFLYNTLSTIQSLCLTDPEKAADTTEKFGTYLRHNIDFLEFPELIPLEKEIEHTKIYADIEMIRFPKISVEYDIKAKDFKLPPLTIQPLVENAIRHGVRSVENGKVTVTTRDEGEYNVIIISDNGIGFDASKNNKKDDEHIHIGVSNVRKRIEDMCSGSLYIHSVVGEGTEITISLPKTKRREYENYLR